MAGTSFGVLKKHVYRAGPLAEVLREVTSRANRSWRHRSSAASQDTAGALIGLFTMIESIWETQTPSFVDVLMYGLCDLALKSDLAAFGADVLRGLPQRRCCASVQHSESCSRWLYKATGDLPSLSETTDWIVSDGRSCSHPTEQGFSPSNSPLCSWDLHQEGLPQLKSLVNESLTSGAGAGPQWRGCPDPGGSGSQ